MTLDSAHIPGFTPEQTWALRALIREAVREANDHDERVDKLEDCIFGNGSAGLKGRMTALEEQVSGLVWLSRTTLAAAIVAVVGVIAQALR